MKVTAGNWKGRAKFDSGSLVMPGGFYGERVSAEDLTSFDATTRDRRHSTVKLTFADGRSAEILCSSHHDLNALHALAHRRRSARQEQFAFTSGAPSKANAKAESPARMSQLAALLVLFAIVLGVYWLREKAERELTIAVVTEGEAALATKAAPTVDPTPAPAPQDAQPAPVAEVEPAAAVETAAEIERFWVTSDTLNRRTCATTQCGIVGKLYFRETVLAHESIEGWVRVTQAYDASCIDGRSAYIDSGDDRCVAENGIVDGKFAEWVSSAYLASDQP